MADFEKLNAKQRAFCEEYVRNGYNGTQAYLTVYECDKDTAPAGACRMLKKPHVKEYIKEIQKEVFEAACISGERIALKLAEIAFASGDNEYYGASSQLKALDLLQKQLGIQHQKIEAEVNTDVVINIE